MPRISRGFPADVPGMECSIIAIPSINWWIKVSTREFGQQCAQQCNPIYWKSFQHLNVSYRIDYSVTSREIWAGYLVNTRTQLIEVCCNFRRMQHKKNAIKGTRNFEEEGAKKREEEGKGRRRSGWEGSRRLKEGVTQLVCPSIIWVVNGIELTCVMIWIRTGTRRIGWHQPEN